MAVTRVGKMVRCPDCEKDKSIVYKRDADAICIHCGSRLCGHHISQHLHDEHCVSLAIDYCK
jgi:hypothetical protein